MSAHKKIMDKLKDKSAEVQNDPTRSVGAVLADEAIEAILNGIESEQWKSYMRNFAETPEQLARLTFNDDKKDEPWVKRSLVYIVANAVCGADTTTRVHDRVSPLIDQGLP